MERVKNFLREENKSAKLFAVLTIVGLFVVGNATGVFATFIRSISLDDSTLSGYGYGYGYDDGTGYGYGYGYGPAEVITPVTPAPVSTGGGGGGGGGSFYAPIATASGTTITVGKTGIVVTTKNSDGTVTTTTFVRPGVMMKSLKEIKFNDISSNWAKNYIQHLVARGVVSNTEKFNPDNNLTRAEFLKIAINAAGLKTSSTGTTAFKDVASDAWYTPYVSLAVSRGIISNKSTNFRPNDSISRAEAAKIIVGIFGGNTSNTKLSFADVDATSDLAKYIETAKTLGFFSGQIVDGKLKFRPNDSITRAEIAKVVVNAFKL